MKKLSILIPVFGKVNFTLSCLKDLSHLSIDETEIIVVDNASPDDTKEKLEALKPTMPNLITIYNEENVGFGKALNKAYEQSTGEYILFLNNDIRVEYSHSDWTDALVAACSENTLVGPTGGKLDERNGFAFLFETNDPLRFKEINYISGWCISAKRSEFDKLILKDNTFKGPWRDSFNFYFEDPDQCWRALEMGFKLKMVSVPVVHFGKVSSKQLNVPCLYKTSRKQFSEIWKNKLTR